MVPFTAVFMFIKQSYSKQVCPCDGQPDRELKQFEMVLSLTKIIEQYKTAI